MDNRTLRLLVHECRDCALSSAGYGVPGIWVVNGVRTEEPQPVDIMFIGEAPGGVEQERLQPFVGSAGMLLDRLLEEVSIRSYYVTNMAKHRPPVAQGKQTAPKPEHMTACRPFLLRELEMVQPKFIVLLGKTAAKLAWPGNLSMKEMVGQRKDFQGIPTLVVWHPAAFLHTTQPRAQTTMMNQFRRALAGLVADAPPVYPIEKVTCVTHG